MISSEKEKLIQKLYSGECSKEELEKLFQLVKTLPKERAMKVMEELWKQSLQYPELEVERSKKMFGNIKGRIGGKTPIIKPLRKSYRRWRLAGMAASLLLVAGLTIWFWSDRTQPVVHTTADLEQKALILPDGSKVKLNSNSTIAYRKTWNDREDRIVKLSGEAFFEVAKKLHTRQKFKVITSDLTVEVFGTVFNVNSRHQQTNVYLEEGQVALKLKHGPEKMKLLEPGEMLTYSARDRSILANRKSASSELYTSWKDGTLTFEHSPLTEVLQKIEAIYGISFEIGSEIDDQRKVTAGLPMEKLELVIPMLEQALNLKIKKTDRGYLIE